MPELVAFLTGQHEQIKDLMQELLDSQSEQRQILFDRLCRMLAVHEAFEQATVHVAAREEGEANVARARIAEETKTGEMIASLEDTDLDSEDFIIRFTALQNYILLHAEHEEQQEFTQLNRVWSEEVMARIAAGMELASDAAAPDGGSLTGNSFHELFSRASQQIRGVGDRHVKQLPVDTRGGYRSAPC